MVWATTPWLVLLLLVLLLLKNRGNANHSGLTLIEQARINKGLSIADVCRLTGLSYDNYIKYERGKVKEQYMSLDTLNKLSAVLEIDLTTDYHKFKANVSEIVKQYMEANSLTIRKFAEMCGVSTTAVKNWRNGVCAPCYELWERFFKK